MEKNLSPYNTVINISAFKFSNNFTSCTNESFFQFILLFDCEIKPNVEKSVMKVMKGPVTYISGLLFGPDDPVLDQFTELYMAVFKTIPIEKLKPIMVISC